MWSNAKSVPISRAIWPQVKKLTELIQIHLSFFSHAFTFYADDCAPPQRFDWINLWAIMWSGNVLLLMTTGKHSVECILLLKVPEHAGSQRRHADFNSLTFQSTWLCVVCGLLPESRESKGRGRKGRAVVESGICRSHCFFSTVSILASTGETRFFLTGFGFILYFFLTEKP